MHSSLKQDGHVQRVKTNVLTTLAALDLLLGNEIGQVTEVCVGELVITTPLVSIL